MIKIIKHQTLFMLRQNIALMVFYILLAIVFLNFGSNVLTFQGRDIIDMYHPAKMLVLSYDQVYDNMDIMLLLIQLYPILIVCPAGFTLLSEKKRKTDCVLITRIGSIQYYLGKTIAAFFVTMIVFTIPFLIEFGLNCVSFPLAASGDFVDLNRYSPDYIELTSNYMFPALFHMNSYLYTFVGILFWGVTSGIIGMFTVALSGIISFRFKILLFLPVYILLNIPAYMPKITDKLPFVNAFGGSILQYMWMPNDDGTVSYEPTSQETRNALEKLAAMYSEGLINEEFGVSDTDAISEAVAAGTCGLFYGTDGISWGAGRDAIANNNDCGWMVINAPSVEGGDATAYSYTNFDYVYAVNANCEHPEALIKLINFNNDRINSPDATLDSLEVWGVNSKTGINQCDYTYALLDPYLNKAIGYNTTIGQVFAGELKPEELMPEAYRYYVGIKRYVDEGYDKTGSANPDDLTAFQYAMCWGPKFGSWTRYSELRDAGMKMSVYTGAPTKTMMKRWSTLLALQDETFVKIISGSLGIEAFDDFVTQWNEQGGSTIQEEIAEMYMK